MSSSKYGRTLVGAAFLASMLATAGILIALSVLGPFDHQNAPPVAWSIVLWSMVGIVIFLLVMRVVLSALAFVAGLFSVGKRGAFAMAHLLKVTLGV